MMRWSFILGTRCFAIAALLAVSACESPNRTIAFDNPEDGEDFQESVGGYSSSIDHLLQETQQGKNVSGFSLGMLSYDILITVSSADNDLREYFTSGGQDIQGYLKTRFQSQPQEEIAALDKMNPDGSSPLRSSARYTLEALTHVPESSDPPAVQQRSREELADALMRTKASLSEALTEASDVKDQSPTTVLANVTTTTDSFFSFFTTTRH